jgi:hypothetical protein
MTLFWKTTKVIGNKYTLRGLSWPIRVAAGIVAPTTAVLSDKDASRHKESHHWYEYR